MSNIKPNKTSKRVMRKATAFPEISVSIRQLMRRHLPGESKLHSLSGGAEICHKFEGFRENGSDAGNIFVPKSVETTEDFVGDFKFARL
jgi:hypothetical protein